MLTAASVPQNKAARFVVGTLLEKQLKINVGGKQVSRAASGLPTCTCTYAPRRGLTRTAAGGGGGGGSSGLPGRACPGRRTCVGAWPARAAERPPELAGERRANARRCNATPRATVAVSVDGCFWVVVGRFLARSEAQCALRIRIPSRSVAHRSEAFARKGMHACFVPTRTRTSFPRSYTGSEVAAAA
jgi:hypothetical protein